jgi:hypothetical protein
MKAGKLLFTLAVMVFVAAGCSKGPSDSSSTYVPPANPVVKEYGTVYVMSDRYFPYNIFIGGVYVGTFPGGSHVTRKVEPGICEIKAVQESGMRPGYKPEVLTQIITVVKDHTHIISL